MILFSSDAGYALFIGLNPSTADETTDDPTIRRCMGFARAWGYQALCMANLFAYRATKPSDMMGADDPIGPENDHTLATLSKDAGVVIAAWGNHGSFLGRDQAVTRLISQFHCLRLTDSGNPAHPLYLPAGLSPVTYRPKT